MGDAVVTVVAAYPGRMVTSMTVLVKAACPLDRRKRRVSIRPPLANSDGL